MSTSPKPLTLTQLGAVVAGNALEFYDFLTFSFFAIQIGATLIGVTVPMNPGTQGAIPATRAISAAGLKPAAYQ